MAGTKYISNASFRFLEELKANNTREWFNENKDRYENDLKSPALRLIEDFAPELRKLSPHFMATPRSLFRIYRDTRFSKDKTPYKTAAGIHFRHERAKDAHAPGFYFHVAPGEVFLGIGIWHPPTPALTAIREHIIDDPAGWKRVSRAKKFTASYHLAGDSLVRAPKGVDPDHPLIEDLRRKDFIGVQEVTRTFATRPDLPKQLAASFKTGLPFMRFLCDALDVPF